MGCLLTSPCCNICTGGYYLISLDATHPSEILSDENISIEDPRDVHAKEKIGCYGNECNKTCKPFIPNEVYIVKGILKFDEYPKRVGEENGHYYLLYSGYRETTGK